MLHKVENVIISLENSICLLSLIIMVGAVALQVSSRYVFKSPISWAEELSRMCLTWLTFVGASMAVRLKAHFAIELLINKFPKHMHNVFEIILLLITAALLTVMFFSGLILLPVVNEQASSTLGLPMSYVYLSIPVGSIFMLFHTCKLIYERITGQYIAVDPLVGAEEN